MLSEQHNVDFYADEWRFVNGSSSVADDDVVFLWPDLVKELQQAPHKNQYGETLRKIAGCLILGIDSCKYAPCTVKRKVIWLRRFFLVLLEHGFESLALITTKRLQELFLVSSTNRTTGKLNCRATVHDRMATVSQLFRLQLFLTDSLREDPFPKLFRRKNIASLKLSSPWEAPPEPVSIYLLKVAMQFIDELGSDLVSVRSKYAQAVDEAKLSGVKNRRAIAQYAYSAISSERFLSSEARSELVRGYDLKNSFHLAVLVKHLETACFIVITFTCGPRVSEVRRATSSSIKSEIGTSGEDVAFYYAKRSKKRYPQATRSPESPDGDDFPWVLSPAAANAFHILERLSKPAREKSGIDNLWLTMTGRALWPINAVNNHTIASNCAINGRMRSFALFIDLAGKTGWCGSLHTHMGRKSLARFIAKRDRSVLEDLAVQYSHTSAYSVDVHYSRPDSEFRRLVKEELRCEMESVATELVGLPPSVVFLANKEVEKTKTASNFFGQFITAADVKVMLARGTVLVPCQWGVCMYRQETSACMGSKSEPNPVNRSPEVCARCSNFISTPKHKIWWENFREDSAHLLRQSNLPAQTRLLLLSRVKDAEEILNVIGG